MLVILSFKINFLLVYIFSTFKYFSLYIIIIFTLFKNQNDDFSKIETLNTRFENIRLKIN